MKPADKGSGIVLMNVQGYVSEANKQLSGTDFYKPANPSNLDKAINLVENLLTAIMYNDKEIDKKCFDYIPHQQSWGRYTGFTLYIRLSVCHTFFTMFLSLYYH